MNLKNKIIKKFDMKLEWEFDGISVYSNNEILLQYIEPHSGTDWKFVVRIDYKETFDRWSVAFYEKNIDNDWDEIKINDTLNDISLIINHKDELLIKVPIDDPYYEERFYYDLADDEVFDRLDFSDRMNN